MNLLRLIVCILFSIIVMILISISWIIRAVAILLAELNSYFQGYGVYIGNVICLNKFGIYDREEIW